MQIACVLRNDILALSEIETNWLKSPNINLLFLM